MTIDSQLLIDAAAAARRNAHAPYSNFPVGAAVLTGDGIVYSGCNVENVSFGLTNCAERTAVFKAVSDGHRTIAAVAIVAGEEGLPYPCGACRQVLAEFGDPDLPIYIAAANSPEKAAQFTLGELLPHTFEL